MKKIMSAVVIATAIGSVSVANAAEGFYIFGDVGQSNFDIDTSSFTNLNHDDNDTMYSIGAGYQINDFWAVEAGYADLGETTFTNTTAPATATLAGDNFTLDGNLAVDATGFFIGAKGSIEVTDRFNLFARAGIFKWESDFSFSGTLTQNGTSVTGSASTKLDDGTDPYIAFGAAYMINDNFAVNLQASRYMLDFDGEDVDIDTVSAGVTYKF